MRIILWGLLGLCSAGASARPYDSAVSTPESVIQRWPGRSRGEARVMISKYCEPAAFDDNSLIWYKNGPWRKTVVYRKAPKSVLGYRAKDILEQSIAYVVPDNKLAALKRFDGRLKFDKTAGELSSLSENENLNYLALNLADEIVTDKRNADEARDFLRKTMKLSESGKTSAYMDGFLFPLIDQAPLIPGEEPAR